MYPHALHRSVCGYYCFVALQGTKLLHHDKVKTFDPSIDVSFANCPVGHWELIPTGLTNRRCLSGWWKATRTVNGT